MDSAALYFSAVLRSGSPAVLRAIRRDYLTPDWQPVYDWVAEFASREGRLPRPETFEHTFSRPLPPAPEDPVYYAREVRLNAMRVALEDGLHDQVVPSLKDSKPGAALDAAAGVVAEVRRTFREFEHSGLVLEDIGHRVGDRMADYQLRKLAKDRIGLPLPWPALNIATGGFLPGALWVLLARPTIGKTWLLVVIAIYLWQKGGYRVLFISMETPPEGTKPRDPRHRVVRERCIRCFAVGVSPEETCPSASVARQQLSIRFDAVGARISAWRMLKGLLTPDEERALAAYYEFLGSGKTPWGALKVMAAPYVSTVSDFYLEVTDWRPDIVIWDSAYLAVGESEGAGSRMNERAGAMVRETKLALERLGIPGIISWHFNRDVDEDATNASPNNAILTDEIGRIADVILGLFRPPAIELAGEATLRTLKVRDGLPLRELKIMFQVKDSIQFAEIGEPPRTRAGGAEEAGKK